MVDKPKERLLNDLRSLLVWAHADLIRIEKSSESLKKATVQDWLEALEDIIEMHSDDD